MDRDIFSDVLRKVRLRGAVYFQVDCGAEFAAEAPHASAIAAAVMPHSEHVMEYHIVLRGSCWGGVVGQQPVRLEHGDVIVFPHGDPHVISSAPGMRAPVDIAGYFQEQPGRPPFNLRVDGTRICPSAVDDKDCYTRLICGFLGCDLRPFNPFIATLPHVLHLKAADAYHWMAPFLLQAVMESQGRRPGCEAMLERMSEMIFIEAMRRYADSLPESSQGWLAGLRDRQIGRVLALIHGDPAADWTVDELGKRVGLSRSTLHERFSALIGQPPMQYLINWRMQEAATLLRTTKAPVASIAQDVGYDSEASFSRAFRRLVGAAPAAWRRAAR